ncbi:MAG: multidrug efflux SMR transporter [Micrococcaceae bacterium]|nr:multidrug efflux SMR transporter [Micrococcaceae bacterium]
MNKWFLLGTAITLEVIATLSLKAALDHHWFYLGVVLGYAGAFTALSLAMRAGLGLGVAYGIWGALGVALTALFAMLLFDESLTPVMLLGLGVIIAGVVLVEFGSQQAQRNRARGKPERIS